MSRLEITLLGSPHIRLDGHMLGSLPAKGLALFIYLVATKQQYAREYLAELLWSDETMPMARKLNNLRGNGALSKLNEKLEDFLVEPRHSLAFKVESDYRLDVDEFEACLRQPNPTVEQLQTAVNLYRNDFLIGFSLRDADGFEDWAQVNRERLRRLALNAHYLLAVHYKQARQYTAGLESITRLLALEPYFEEAHREMMLLLALTGQVSGAAAHYERYWDTLDAEGLEPEAETKALYQKLLRGEIVPDTAVPPPITTPAPPTWTPPFQTPPSVRHFVGRQERLAQIVAELQKPDAPKVHALAGMGGVGKSTLAKEIAHAAQEYFEDGVLWASVAVSEPTAVLESWAQAYGYDFSRLGDVESMAMAFRGVLAEKRVLLVLDDVTSAARVRPLLPNGPGCRVLLTTRDQDLAYALDAKVWPLNELSPENGRLLLAHILGEERVNAEAEAATMICHLLQNLPLAVEIIGQRLKSRPQRKLVDIIPRLRDEKQRLSELHISDREVRASFAISYATLDTDLRQMFGLMGVFHGRSFTADALAALAVQDRYETEDCIFALTALSLAQADGPIRYRQHPLLADFAREKLEGGDEGEVYGRFSHHYLTFAQQHPHDYDALRPEWENLMAAMQAAHDRDLWQTVIDFADALHDGWFVRGRYTQARLGFNLACQSAQVQQDLYQQAKLLHRWGRACTEQKDYAQANTLLSQSLEIFQSLNAVAEIANNQCDLARIALEQADYPLAQALLETSEALSRQMGSQDILAEALYQRARLYYFQGDYSQTQFYGTQALNLQEKLGSDKGILGVANLLASNALVRQEYELAEHYCQRVLDLCQKVQDKNEEAMILNKFSDLYRRLNRLDLAEEYAEKSLNLLISIGDLGAQASTLYQLSLVKERLGQYQASLEIGLHSLEICRTLQYLLLLSYVLIHVGDVYHKLGESDQAYGKWIEALELAKKLQHPTALALLQTRLTL